MSTKLAKQVLQKLSSYTLAELRRVAPKCGIKGAWKMNTGQIVTALKKVAEPAVPPSVAKAANTDDKLASMNVDQLRKYAYRELGISGTYRMTRDQILAKIRQATKDVPTQGVGQTSQPKAVMETTKPRPEAGTGDLLFTGMVERSNPNEVTIMISCGASVIQSKVVGMTVAQVRGRMGSFLNIPANSIPLVNGKKVEPNYMLREYDHLEFTVRAGRKG